MIAKKGTLYLLLNTDTTYALKKQAGNGDKRG